jgi:Ca-activated chloride channel family protein
MTAPKPGSGSIVLDLTYPYALFALPLPLLVMWLLPPHRTKVSALRVPFFNMLIDAAGITPQAGAIITRPGFADRLVIWIVWIAVIAGLAKPVEIGEPIIHTEAARDIMLAVDLSGSMAYADFPGEDGKPVSRFDAVARVIERFVAGRQSDRIGLIVFGDRAYLQLPFTRDLETAVDLVHLMEVGMAGPRTALGDAIGLSIHAFEDSEVDDRVLILLTDGSDTASKMTPVNAAGIAKLNRVQIHTIGIGNIEATGEDRVDFASLQDIASRTGGAFFTADNENALATIYERIDAATTADVRTESYRPRTSLVHWPATAAIIILGLLCATGLLRRSST